MSGAVLLLVGLFAVAMTLGGLVVGARIGHRMARRKIRSMYAERTARSGPG